MRKVLLPFIVLLLISLSASFAQTLMDYVSEVRGDTLVIKDYTDMGGEASSLNNVLLVDTDAPAGRVYELKAGGWYPQAAGVTTPDRPVVIVG